MPKKYKHIFFDLDHTLWDFERNAEETKREMFEILKLKDRGIDNYEIFRARYIGINQALWALYRENKIEKDELNFRRFYDTLCLFGIDDIKLGEAMAEAFIEGITTKTYLFPFTRELLDYLFPKYPLHIITNGFDEVQFGKLKNSDLGKYFTQIITSEEAGSKKPDPEIFHFALQKAGADAAESLMIGDDLEVDMAGARQLGIDQIYVNHDRKIHGEPVTMEVFSLDEIWGLL
ncbi:MAG: YjjG family noncanonical pyrimidine nucleotidase [Bacteroidota bacterium]